MDIMISKLVDVIKIYDEAMEKHCSKQERCTNCDFDNAGECILLLIINHLKDNNHQ